MNCFAIWLPFVENQCTEKEAEMEVKAAVMGTFSRGSRALPPAPSARPGWRARVFLPH